jgi:CIC family chloride channel protein
MGAALGAICGALLHRVDPHSLSQLSAYAVVGMGALLAATTHAPLTSILLIFEMTLDYDVVLPLMLACVTAHYVARIYLRGESVYTRSLRATLVEQDAEWRLRQIGALVRPPALVLQRDEPLRAALSRAQARGAQRAYVVDDEQQLVGELDLASVRGPQRGVTPDGNVTVAHHMIAAPAVLTPDMLLGDALDVFIAHRARRLPVVAGNWSPVLLGEVSRHDLLLALQDRMTERPGAT